MGGPNHIALNGPAYLDAWMSSHFEDLRIDTLCGKNLKFTDGASSMKKMIGWVRSACEECFMQYEPEEEEIVVKAPPIKDTLPF